MTETKNTLEIPVRCMGSKDSDCDGLFFGGPSQLELRLVIFFGFCQSRWDVSTLSTQTFPYTLPFNETNIACCMLNHEHHEAFDGLGGLSMQPS